MAWRRAFAAVAIAGLGFSGLAQPATADDDDDVAVVQLNGMFVKDSAVPVDGLASLTRSSKKIKLKLETRIDPGHAATVWWIIYNDPTRCVGGPAAPGLEQRCVSSDRVWDHASVLYGGGMVAGPDGRFTVKSKLKAGDLAAVAMGPGLTNPLGAEVHAVVRTHGLAAADATMRQSQISSMDGGCSSSELPDDHPLRGIWADSTACRSILWTFFAGVGPVADVDDDD